MNKDLELIKNKLIKDEPFSLIRFGDGELNIINNVACQRKGFRFDPENKTDQKFRQELINSLEHMGGDNYLVGINPEELKPRAKSPIVSASLFINEHYIDFLKNVAPIFKIKPIYLICNVNASTKTLKFKPKKVCQLINNAWTSDVYEKVLNDLKNMDYHIILVAGGVYSCTLIHRLWRKVRKHTLIDIGSVYDPGFYGKKTREYHNRLEELK